MSEIERYLDELFDQLAATGAPGKRALVEAEDHLRAAATEAMARGLPADRAEQEAVARFGSAAMVARRIRSAHGGGHLGQACSVAWLLTGLAAAGLGVAYLAAASRLGWQAPGRACTNLLSAGCYFVGPVTHDIQSALIAAAVGAVLLIGRWPAVRYAGLAPVRHGLALAMGLMLGLAAFGSGMVGRIPVLPDGVFTGLLWPPLGHTSLVVAATALIECLAAAVALADSPRQHLRRIVSASAAL